MEYRREIKKQGKVVDFGTLHLYSPNTLPLEILEPQGILKNLKFCFNQKKGEIKPC